MDELLPRHRLVIKKLERLRLTPLRATRGAEGRGVDARATASDSDGLGAIFPPIIYHAIVLRCLGVPDDDPEMHWADEATRRPVHRGGRHAPLAAVHVAGVGHRAVADRRSPTPGEPSDSERDRSRRALAARQGSAAAPATGRRPFAASSPAAGSSSTATPSTRTPTTPRWC